MSITEQYLYYHNEYRMRYGIKSLVLMQVGSFYEIFSTETDGPCLKEIGELLGIRCIKINKNIEEISITNPYIIGFPIVASEKFVSTLIRNGYILVIVHQITEPPQIKREVTNVINLNYFDDIY